MSTPPLVTGPLTTPSRDTPFVRSVRKEEEADFWIGAKEDDVGRMIRQHRHMHGDARNVAVPQRSHLLFRFTRDLERSGQLPTLSLIHI